MGAVSERARAFAVSLGPAAVTVRSPLDLVAAHRGLHAEGFWPLYGVRQLDTDGGGQSAAPTPVPATLLHVDGAPPQVTVERGREAGSMGAAGTGGPGIGIGEQVLVRCPSGLLDGGAALFPAITVLMERRLQLAGLMSLQAACVCWRGRAVLIFGPPGCGKTTTAVTLCRSHGARLVGNDLVVAGLTDRRYPATGAGGGPRDRPTVVTGSTAVYVRPDALARHHPDLLELTGLRARPEGWAKIPLRPEVLGMETETGAVDLVGAYVVHVDDRLQHARVSAPPAGVRYWLYENATRYLRATAEPFLGDAGQRFLAYLPGLDDPACHRARVDFVERVIDGLELRRISGTAADVAALIAADAGS